MGTPWTHPALHWYQLRWNWQHLNNDLCSNTSVSIHESSNLFICRDPNWNWPNNFWNDDTNTTAMGDFGKYHLQRFKRLILVKHSHQNIEWPAIECENWLWVFVCPISWFTNGPHGYGYFGQLLNCSQLNSPFSITKMSHQISQI